MRLSGRLCCYAEVAAVNASRPSSVTIGVADCWAKLLSVAESMLAPIEF